MQPLRPTATWIFARTICVRVLRASRLYLIINRNIWYVNNCAVQIFVKKCQSTKKSAAFLSSRRKYLRKFNRTNPTNTPRTRDAVLLPKAFCPLVCGRRPQESSERRRASVCRCRRTKACLRLCAPYCTKSRCP